jgi:hypothetical protein
MAKKLLVHKKGLEKTKCLISLNKETRMDKIGKPNPYKKAKKTFLTLALLVIIFSLLFINCKPPMEDINKDSSDDEEDLPDETYKLVIVIFPEGSGHVTPGSGTYKEDSLVSLMAIPNTGWFFDHWEVDVTGSNNPVELIIDDNKYIKAIFYPDPSVQCELTITVTPAGSGSVSPGSGFYPEDSFVTLEAKSNTGWIFDHWEIDLSGTDNPAQIQMNEDKSIKAVFVKGEIYDGDFNISNQGDIDFLSGFREVTGDLTVCASLVDMKGLESLISVGRTLHFHHNSSLINLKGLNNLQYIGRDLYIVENDNLKSLKGLESLETIASQVWIYLNPSLLEIGSMNNLTSVGSIEIALNELLTEINGFKKLEHVNGHLDLVNENLSNLNGFNMLNRIEGKLYISRSALTNLEGLGNLTYIGKELTVAECPFITNFDALSSLTSTGGLGITLNESLTNIDGLSDLNTIGGGFSIQNNSALANVNGLHNVTIIKGNLLIRENCSLTNLDGLDNLTILEGGYLKITDNIVLPTSEATSLDERLRSYGFSGITIISGNAP